MSSKLKILHIGNGKAFKIKAIIDALLLRGHEIHMLPIPPASVGWEGVVWHALPKTGWPGQAAIAARMLQVRRLARRLRPDVVHAHNAWGPGWYGAFCGLHPFLIQAYGGDLLPEQYNGRSLRQRKLTSWACRKADRIIVTGEHMIKAAGGLDIAQDRISLIPRGVDLRRYHPGIDAARLRRELGIEQASAVILSPRYQVDEPLYNLDVVVEAVGMIRDRIPGAVCLQFYDPDRENGRRLLEACASKHGLDSSCYRLIPTVENSSMPLYYNLATVVVSVPSSDGFPVSVLEASACGAPLVVSRLPYCDEWFVNGENGFIVPVRNAKALAEAVIALCGDGELRRRFGAAGRAMVEIRADYHRCMDRLENLYWQLLGEFKVDM